MQKRRLGAGGPEVSAIGVGAMSFAGVYGRPTEAEAHALLAAALDLGIDHIDTSNVYGMGLSESDDRQLPRARARFRVATKAAIRHRPGDEPALVRQFGGASRRRARGQPEAARARDGRSLLRPSPRPGGADRGGGRGAWRGLVRAGKTRAIGFSEIAPASLRRAAAVHPVAAVQSEYSLSTRAPELGLVEACADARHRARRLLAGRAGHPDRRAADAGTHRRLGFPERRTRASSRRTSPPTSRPPTVSARLAAEMGTSAAALAIAWLLSPQLRASSRSRARARPRTCASWRPGPSCSFRREDLARIDAILPAGWAHGDRYTHAQWVGPERYS